MENTAFYCRCFTMSVLNFVEKGQGFPLVLIHGLFGSMDNLNMVARKLCEHFRVINIDARNHGHSFWADSMNYTEMAQDIVDLLAHLSIPECHVLGHSMGGKIAMQLALEHGHLVNKLVVADIAPVAYPPHHNRIIEGMLEINNSKIESRKQADRILAQFVDDFGVRQFLLRNLAKQGNDYQLNCNVVAIANCYSQIMQGYQGNNHFDGPTLFLKGGNSDYLKPEHQTLIAKLFPNATAKVINGAGHWLHAEKSVVFNRIVTEFIYQVE